ncbi:PREDICTED: CXADR-like membrane protein isoform X2 [Gekko japonicus]|uniref:CXADR-like membrane protein isoform X2 n=1 Tax=Gekko japonicus TaxID=146911 RepID=A0ABM1JKA9_GEKJA|nr:PREDICTED: CXADR-like membrane protein isoform X2 [Gekko japonicus]
MQLRGAHSRGVTLNFEQVCLPFPSGKKFLKREEKSLSLSLEDGMSALSILILATCTTWMSQAQTLFTRVAEANVTLPCHHQLHLLGPTSLDIEWLLQDSEADPKVVITYAGDRIYPDFIKEQKGRVSFASNFRAGDASLEISFLKPSDAGLYTCKVKNAGHYEWNHITLEVLEKPSKPKCWKEGEMSEGKEITLQCNSASGTKPITYQWKRIIDEEGKTGSLPPMTRINFSNPAQIMMKNLTRLDSGSYQCTASNDAGQDSCTVQVTVLYARNLGIIAGAACGAIAVPILVFLTAWLTIRRKEKNKYEEESPNEIREDAEAPKARLVKPGSSSSGSRSSHSGSSSTRSTANSASRSQQTLSTEATPHITPTQHSQVDIDSREIEPKKINNNLVKTEVTSTMVPAQSRAFQTV